VNQTADDWLVEAKITGQSFSGPDVLTAVAGKVTDYPLKFLPLSEGAVEVMAGLRYTEDYLLFYLLKHNFGDNFVCLA